MPGIVTGAPRMLLRLKGLSVLVAATIAYSQAGAARWHYAILFLAPDLAMMGYLGGRKVGAVLYNASHWYVLPLACVIWGSLAHAPTVLAVGLIWAAHIGFDRALGYGLKYSQGFSASHLGGAD